MSDDLIKCEICGALMSIITYKHLARHNMVLAEYTELYPNSPTRSNTAILKKQAAAKQANSSRKGIPRSDDVKQKIRKTKKDNPVEAWNKGVPKTSEERKHLSDVKKEQYRTGKITHWNTGNNWAEEIKQKISNTLKSQNRIYSDKSKLIRQRTIEAKKRNGWTHHSSLKFLSKLSNESLTKYNDPDWLTKQHIDNKRTVASLCVELGLHWKNSNKTITSQLRRFDIPIQYWHQASSIQQRDVEQFLIDNDVTIHTRNRSLIRPLELDIYLPDYQIAVEYCGLYWHTTQYKDPDYHYVKYSKCQQQGIRLITIYSDEWLNNTALVKQKLLTILNKSNLEKIPARKCNIIPKVPNEYKIKFLNNNHIQGTGPGSITIGLEYNNVMVACMTFIKQADNTYILNRYATSVIVVGGFSKLLTYFKREFKWSRIVSFADLRWSQGHLYETNGFILECNLPPDYQYVIKEERIHKFNFRHKYLSRILPDYDPNLSETQNTFNAGIYKIYNCGLQRWVLLNQHNEV